MLEAQREQIRAQASQITFQDERIAALERMMESR